MEQVLSKVLAVILGGGRGTRLWPLTKMRAKPAVPIAGKYRLIDIPMSNCLHSGIFQVSILTQFLSVSLHRHITQTYHFDAFHPGWVQILAAEQTMDSTDWYQGTADAVRKQLVEITASRAEHVLILAGDHLYRMDYSDMIKTHVETGADITLAVKPVSREDAARFGVLKLDSDKRCVAFTEKPNTPQVIDEFECRDDPELPLLGSMGIYVFKHDLLVKLLNEYDHTDFGRDVLPGAIEPYHVQGYEFEGYWEDIGTIRSFYEANLALATPESPFDFHEPLPVYTRSRFLPCSLIEEVSLDQVLLADGCNLKGAELKHSVVGVRSIIGKGACICHSILSGCDWYEHDVFDVPTGAPPMGIGEGSHISGAIIDKDARIGKNVTIDPFPKGTEIDQEKYYVRDGIVVIPKGTILPNGTKIGPEQ